MEKNQIFNVIKIACIPKELELYKESKESFEKSFGTKIKVLSISEAKGDKKAKPGKPAIYIE